MRNGVVRWAAVCAAVVSGLAFEWIARAGSLTPSGAPAPSMKTLNEVEARIPVGPLTTPGDASAVYVISQPGSYYLTGNITGQSGKHGISIASRDVTLDLNGFALVGGPGSLNGVNMSGYTTAVKIHNGIVRDWGVSGVSARIDGGEISDLRIYVCGRWGIDLASSFAPIVRNCNIRVTGTTAGLSGGGISTHLMAIIEGCQVDTAQGVGILAPEALVTGCIALSITADPGALQNGEGIIARQVETSRAQFCAGVGISGHFARGCVSLSNSAPYAVTHVVESY